MKKHLAYLLPVLLILLIGGVLWSQRLNEDAGVSRTLACADLRQGCSVELDGTPVTVRMLGALKPLSAFRVEVHAPQARRVEARFTMEGMDMGFNLYTLRADKAGMFTASVTLPVCVSGRRDWVMQLRVDDSRLSVPFVTDM
ncbi:MAG: hypothetical protein AB1831_10930 [Pseudomonadota bacterium]